MFITDIIKSAPPEQLQQNLKSNVSLVEKHLY